jgi:hypothetical protein
LWRDLRFSWDNPIWTTFTGRWADRSDFEESGNVDGALRKD